MTSVDYHIRSATQADIPALVDLHYRVFDERTHYGLLFGRRFIRASYCWYCQAPSAFALVGEMDGEIKGSCTVNQGSYYAVLQHNLWALAGALLARPFVLFAAPTRRRLLVIWRRWRLRRSTPGPARSQAYLAYLAVDATARGTGMGKDLIQKSMEECARRGWGEIVTAIHRSNLSARFLYKTLGFEDDPAHSDGDLAGMVFGRPPGDATPQE
jgi:ribosomal protein S18 acetylase RimI-like enzyme